MSPRSRESLEAAVEWRESLVRILEGALERLELAHRDAPISLERLAIERALRQTRAAIREANANAARARSELGANYSKEVW